jgi:hypothetical protein
MMESSIFGVSVRAWLALITVASGLGFLYAAAFLFSDVDGVLITIITAVTTFIGLALGYYLGQKTSSMDTTTTTNTNTEAADVGGN